MKLVRKTNAYVIVYNAIEGENSDAEVYTSRTSADDRFDYLLSKGLTEETPDRGTERQARGENCIIRLIARHPNIDTFVV